MNQGIASGCAQHAGAGRSRDRWHPCRQGPPRASDFSLSGSCRAQKTTNSSKGLRIKVPRWILPAEPSGARQPGCLGQMPVVPGATAPCPRVRSCARDAGAAVFQTGLRSAHHILHQAFESDPVGYLPAGSSRSRRCPAVRLCCVMIPEEFIARVAAATDIVKRHRRDRPARAHWEFLPEPVPVPSWEHAHFSRGSAAPNVSVLGLRRPRRNLPLRHGSGTRRFPAGGEAARRARRSRASRGRWLSWVTPPRVPVGEASRIAEVVVA